MKNYFKKNTFILFVSVFISISNIALGASPFWVGVGSTTHNFLTAQSDDQGATKKFEFAPTVLIGSTIPFLYSGLFLSPGLGYATFTTKDNTSKTELILQYHLSSEIFSFFLLQYGFSNYITKIAGKGGTVSINNGSGMSTFYVPSTAKTTYTASLDLGAEFVFTSNISTRMQLSVLRFLSSERRRVSHLLTLNYYF